MTERKKSWVFALVVTIAFICVSLVCAGTVTAAVIVDQDLVWNDRELPTGGGMGIWPDSVGDITSGTVYGAEFYQVNPAAALPADFDQYTDYYYIVGGQRYGYGGLSGAPLIYDGPGGILRFSNSDVAYSWEIAGYDDPLPEPLVYFGLGPFDGYVSWPVILVDPGARQHVTINDDTLFVYNGVLERNGVVSTAVLRNSYMGGQIIATDTGSSDWSFSTQSVVGAPFYIDVTVGDQTITVVFGGPVPPTGIPTPIPTNNTTIIPTLDLDNDPLGLDDWGPGGSPPLPPALPDLPTINIPDPDDFFDPFLNDTNNVTRPLFDMVDRFVSGFWDGLFGGVANVWSSLWASFADLVDGVKNFFYQIDDLMYKASGFMYDLSPVIYAVVPSVVWYLALITVWGSVVVLGYQLVTSPLVDLLRSKFDYWTLKDQYGRFGGK